MDTQEAGGICSLFQSPSSLHTNILLPSHLTLSRELLPVEGLMSPSYPDLCRHQSFCPGCSSTPLWLLHTFCSSDLTLMATSGKPPLTTLLGQIPYNRFTAPWSSTPKHLLQLESDFRFLCISGYLICIWFLQSSGENKVQKTRREGRQIYVWICLLLCPSPGGSPNAQKELPECLLNHG